jgi:hypothetical protein
MWSQEGKVRKRSHDMQRDLKLHAASILFDRHALLTDRRRLSGLFEVVDWFLCRRTNMLDRWPNSKTTILHHISAVSGRIFTNNARNYETTAEDALSRIADLFTHTVRDDCECSCSTHGCASITVFFKHARGFSGTKWTQILTLLGPGCLSAAREPERRAFKKILWRIARAAKGTTHRWIVTELIRLCVFSWLGIRHICCDLRKIDRCVRASYFPRQQPFQRYPPDELQRIREEDAYLTEILEKTVPLLDARYDTHEGDLQSFVDDILRPEMKVVLDRLKQEDEMKYAVSRREMGVVMIEDNESGA